VKSDDVRPSSNRGGEICNPLHIACRRGLYSCWKGVWVVTVCEDLEYPEVPSKIALVLNGSEARCERSPVAVSAVGVDTGLVGKNCPKLDGCRDHDQSQLSSSTSMAKVIQREACYTTKREDQENKVDWKLFHRTFALILKFTVTTLSLCSIQSEPRAGQATRSCNFSLQHRPPSHW
jgi:hypothetical protein